MLYITKTPHNIGLVTNQRALLIFDKFTEQMISSVKEIIEKHNFAVVNVRGNLPKHYQVLYIRVNKYAKAFTRQTFNEWYMKETHLQLNAGALLE